MDREQVFDEDYLYFYEPFQSDEATAAQVELIWRLLELEPGMEVLDLACGHGRIANRLAERGATSRGVTERIVIRDGRSRRFDFSVRMFIAAELGDWCRQAGFDAVEFYDNEGTPLTAQSRRMITIARR